MSCISTGLKVITSRSCELASISELDLDLDLKDPDFVQVARKFLKNLKLVETDLPLPQGICREAEEILAIDSTCDGAIPRFGSIAYLVCQDVITEERKSSICCSKSVISKCMISANESLARILQADLTKSVARVLPR